MTGGLLVVEQRSSGHHEVAALQTEAPTGVVHQAEGLTLIGVGVTNADAANHAAIGSIFIYDLSAETNARWRPILQIQIERARGA